MPSSRITKGIEIEGGGVVGDSRDQRFNPFGVDFQYEWEGQPSRYHTQWLHVPEFWLDTTPVTQGAYASYLVEKSQRDGKALPDDRYHYLANWNWTSADMPTPFTGNATLPVTYIGIDEARGAAATE